MPDGQYSAIKFINEYLEIANPFFTNPYCIAHTDKDTCNADAVNNNCYWDPDDTVCKSTRLD